MLALLKDDTLLRSELPHATAPVLEAAATFFARWNAAADAELLKSEFLSGMNAYAAHPRSHGGAAQSNDEVLEHSIALALA